MIEAGLTIDSGSGRRSVRLSSYLSPEDEERAHAREYAWIKGLRNLDVDGQRFRDRFTARGDSLWWFTELYLHKGRVVLDIYRALAAIDALISREAPSRITIDSAPPVVRHVLPALAAARRVAAAPRIGRLGWRWRLASLDLRARRLALAAHLAPDRLRTAPAVGAPQVAAFVHRAFWRKGGEDGSAESYIGPVLSELEHLLGARSVSYVGIGAHANFRERRKLRSIASAPASVVPIERFAPAARLRAFRNVWRERHSHLGVLVRSATLRDAAVFDGIDCWPLIREQLAGIAWLQWPWSVRAMDEAAAALDTLRPPVVLTYAEAGGWGRALILEARRRGIPSVGLQHGFIYRHWLNYLHEPDEMPDDELSGFPRPTKTLVYDEYAASHLRDGGRFPAGAVQVTGSPRLDALVQAIRSMSKEAVAAMLRELGIAPTQPLVLVTTKEREARGSLPALLEAAQSIPGAMIVIKPHPAETAESYAAAAQGRRNVRVLAPSAPLAPLLAAATAVVTVNSTVALDAAVLGVPALAIGLPNNLSPFVEAGAIAGSTAPAELPVLLQRILYDEGFRQQLAERRRVVLGRSAMGSDGRAAARTAEAVRDLVGQGRTAGRSD